MKEDKTPAFAKLLADRKRQHHIFDVGGFFDMRGEPLAKVAIRVATKREQDLAWARAEDYTYKLRGKELHEAYKDAGGILEDAKIAFLLAQIVRDAENPDGSPIWPTGDLIIERLTADEIATLLHLANEVRSKESAAPQSIDYERLEALMLAAAMAADTDIPEAILAQYPREYVTHAFVLASQKVMEARAEVATMHEETARLRAEVAMLELELAGEDRSRHVGSSEPHEGSERELSTSEKPVQKDP